MKKAIDVCTSTPNMPQCLSHDCVIKRKHFPRYWPFVRGIQRSPCVGFPSQRPVTRSFDIFFDLCLSKRLSKQSRCRGFETPLRSLWRHYNDLNPLKPDDSIPGQKYSSPSISPVILFEFMPFRHNCLSYLNQNTITFIQQNTFAKFCVCNSVFICYITPRAILHCIHSYRLCSPYYSTLCLWVFWHPLAPYRQQTQCWLPDINPCIYYVLIVFQLKYVHIYLHGHRKLTWLRGTPTVVRSKWKQSCCQQLIPWWRHQMETFST